MKQAIVIVLKSSSKTFKASLLEQWGQKLFEVECCIVGFPTIQQSNLNPHFVPLNFHPKFL